MSLPQVQNHCVDVFTVSVPFLPPHANWDMSLGPSSDWGSCLRGSDLYCHRFSETYCLHVMSQGLLVLRGLSPYLHLTWSYCVCWLWDIPELSKTVFSPQLEQGLQSSKPQPNLAQELFSLSCKIFIQKLNWPGFKNGELSLSKMKYPNVRLIVKHQIFVCHLKSLARLSQFSFSSWSIIGVYFY